MCSRPRPSKPACFNASLNQSAPSPSNATRTVLINITSSDGHSQRSVFKPPNDDNVNDTPFYRRWIFKSNRDQP